MLESKPLLKSILVVFVLIAINNVILLHLLGYFSDDRSLAYHQNKMARSTQVVAPAAAPQLIVDESTNRAENGAAKSQSSNTENSRFDEAFRLFMKSEAFAEAMDSYQASASDRYMKLERQLRDADFSTLIGLATESNNELEKNLAAGILRQGLHKLDAVDLKALYQRIESPAWDRNAIIVALIEKGDSQALQWGKEQLRLSLDSHHGVQHELFESLYDKDPEFVKQFVGTIDVENNPSASNMVFLFSSRPELAREFYSKNFDQILGSEDSRLFQSAYGNAKLDLSRSQQVELSSLFESSNRHKRSFAINFAPNIEDVDLLRDSFYQLEKTREKLQLLHSLSMNKANEEQQALIKEIVESADEAEVKKFGSRLN